jgi:protein-S-isoprenylcysteine O-methyltransferase Ste14
MQIIMLIGFFGVWVSDFVSGFLFGRSTILVSVVSHLLLIVPAVCVLIVSVYLVAQSHNAVFRDTSTQSRVLDSGVYSWVRHPMYLGVLLFCLGFLVASFSIVSLGVWLMFFYLYEKMTAYEEDDLIRIFGDQYREYQQRVGKWIPHVVRRV